MQKLMPPLGEILVAFKKESVKLEMPIFIYTGEHAAKHAKYNTNLGSLCLYLPNGIAADCYDWSVVHGEKIVIMAYGMQSINKLNQFALLLLKSGASIVSLHTDDAPLRFYKL